MLGPLLENADLVIVVSPSFLGGTWLCEFVEARFDVGQNVFGRESVDTSSQFQRVFIDVGILLVTVWNSQMVILKGLP